MATNTIAEALSQLTPEQQDQWRKQFAAPPTAPLDAVAPDTSQMLADNSAGNVPDRVKSYFKQGPVVSDAPMPFPPPTVKTQPAGTDWMKWADSGGPPAVTTKTDEDPLAGRMPKGGDWAGYQKSVEKDRKLANEQRIKEASFDNPDARYEQYDADPRAQQQQPGRMVKVSDGGRTPHSWTTQVQEGMVLPQNVYDAYSKADEATARAIDAEKAVAEQKARYDSDYAQANQKYMEGFQANQAARAERQRAEMEKHMGELSRLQEAAAGDPTDSFYDKHGGTGTRILFAMLSGLGGLAAANNGGRNPVLDAINARVQNEKDALNGAVKNKHNFLGELKLKFGDERMAEEAARITYLEKAKAQLGVLSSELGGAAAEANAQKALAMLDTNIADRTKTFEAAAAAKVATSQNDVNAPAQYMGVGGATVGQNATYKEPRKGFTGELHSLSDDYGKAKIPEKVAALTNAERAIDIYSKESIPGVGMGQSMLPDWAVSKDAARNRQALAHLKNQIIHELSGAAVSPTEMERYRTELEGARDEEGIRRFVRGAHQETSVMQRNIARGHAPDVVNFYLQQGGPVRDIRPDKALTPTIKTAE